eukprot:scaffold2541_cov175-Amphora_coffeaeformis.AAC.3
MIDEFVECDGHSSILLLPCSNDTGEPYTMRVEISLFASKLKNVAGFGKGVSDPYAVVTKLSDGGRTLAAIGRTEVVKNSLSPHWVKVFVVDYELGIPFVFAVSIFDEHTSEKSKPMGSAVFELGEVLGARGSTKAKHLHGKGTVFAMARKSTGCGTLRFQFRGDNVSSPQNGLLGISFRRISSDSLDDSLKTLKAGGNTVWDTIYRSDPVMDDLEPAWDEATIELSHLCGGDFDLPILVKIFDHERSGKHILMGKFETTVNMLVESYLDADTTRCMTLSGQGTETTGRIFVEIAEVSLPEGDPHLVSFRKSVLSRSRPDFVEYVNGGCDIKVAVAIDYSTSNGHPREDDSLHFLDPDGGSNDYEMAIEAILGILSSYDDDNRFPVFGFGAEVDGASGNWFQCGLSDESDGISGVLEDYRSTFNRDLVMSQVLDFTDVIIGSAKQAERMLESAQGKGKQAYTVLLILTGGVGVDIKVTVEALKQAIEKPLSVIFVGVGEANFSAMENLDEALKEHGCDMVNFVHFNKYRNNSRALTSATLKKIPDQLVNFFQGKGIEPLSPVQINEEDLEVDEVEGEEEAMELSFIQNDDGVEVTGDGSKSYQIYVPY